MAIRATWSPEGQARYSAVAIFLHWTIAALILFNLVTGLFHEDFPRAVMAIHISSGITILALSVVRVIWRLTHRAPPFVAGLQPWERGAAHVVHFCLYAAMLLVPLSGWAMLSANPPPGSPGAAYAAAMREHRGQASPVAAALPPGNKAEHPAAIRPRRQTMVWWVIPLPMIAPLQEMGRTPEGVPAQHEKHEQIETFHAVGAYVILFLLVLHVAGALKHQFYDGKREFARMGIG